MKAGSLLCWGAESPPWYSPCHLVGGRVTLELLGSGTAEHSVPSVVSHGETLCSVRLLDLQCSHVAKSLRCLIPWILLPVSSLQIRETGLWEAGPIIGIWG